MIDNNLNLSTCRVKVNRQIRKLKITKLKQQVIPTYCHIDSTDVIENDYICLCIFIIFTQGISRVTMGHMHKPLANAFTCINER
jgi:hypothetical protein